MRAVGTNLSYNSPREPSEEPRFYVMLKIWAFALESFEDNLEDLSVNNDQRNLLESKSFLEL